MRRYIKTLIFVIALISFGTQEVKAEEKTDINELIEKAKELDEKDIVVEGEVIGEKMVRGQYGWININDGTNAVGIWMNKKDIHRVTYYGSYKYLGDKVRIKGTFHRACKDHGGEADIHCTSIQIIEKGHYVDRNIPIMKVLITMVLLMITIVMILCYYKTSKNVKIIKE